MRSTARIVVRILAFLGLAISTWLLWQKLNGSIDSIAGCGAGSSCANVLGSRWSQVFMIPVSALSGVLYLGLLVLTFRPRATPMFVIGVLLIGAAVWFTGLQAFVLKSFCPWCLGTHGVGFICGVSILLGLDPRPSEPVLPLVTAGLMLGILILGQSFGPRPATYLLTEEGGGGEFSNESDVASSESAEPTRKVAFFGGKRIYELDRLPHIGRLDAPHVLVEYFDYTCGSCRSLHGDLKALQAAYPDQVTVITLPCPLNRACNSGMLPQMSDHQDACEIARIALAAWKARPEVFEEIHDELFAAAPLSAEAAEVIATRHVPKKDLDLALTDPWIDELLKSNVADFSKFIAKTEKMPKLLIMESTMLHGLSSSTEEFVKVVGEKLGLQNK